MTKQPDNSTRRLPPRRLEDLNLMDDFLFQEMLMQEETGEEFCRILLSTILGRTFRRVKVIPQKSILGISNDRHGIRLDAYIEDLSAEDALPGVHMSDARVVSDIYDIEPNSTYEKETLPKRTRYYHSLIDAQLLEKGLDYGMLPNVTTIIILPYDPFGQNRMLYTFKMQCTEDPSVAYNDGTTKIFLYTKGKCSGKALSDMLKYMQETTDDNVTNQDIEAIHRLVRRVKQNQEVGINYMKSWEREAYIRNEGKIEGKAEGRNSICQLIRLLTEADRTDDIQKLATDPAYCDQLLEEYGIGGEEG
ncbi:MAG: Rpn family recombination-promoting nuclease/putative transposase [Roseburia sp.]|nr:Rpn family recombination-promoting nuclease/putative transposase [Roseburia sp.]